MLTLLQQASELLVSEQERPGVVDPGDPILAPLVQQVLHLCDLETAQTFVALHPRTVDLPGVHELLPWLSALQPPLRTVLGLAFSALGAQSADHALLDALEQELARTLRGVTPTLPSPVEHYPLAAFIGAFGPCGESTPAALTAFSRHGLWLLQTLRAFQHKLSQSPTPFRPHQLRRNTYDFSVALRRVAPHLPTDEENNLVLTPDRIASAVAALGADLTDQGLKPTTIEAQCRKARMLLEEGRGIYPKHSTRPRIATRGFAGRLHSTESTGGRASLLWLEEACQATGTPLLEAGSIRQVAIAANLPTAALEEGESPFEHAAELLLDDDFATDPFLAILRLRHADAAQARDLVGATCSSPVQLDDLLHLDERLAQRALSGQATITDLAVALLRSYFIPIPRLLATEWATADEPALGRLVLEPRGVMGYSLGADDLGYVGRALPGEASLYRPGGGLIRLPLSEGVRMLLDQGSRQQRRRGAIFNGLDQRDLDAAVSDLVGRPLTAAALREGSQRWYQAAGLQRIYAALLKGQASFAERATRFYVNVLPSRVGAEHAAAGRRQATLGGQQLGTAAAPFYTPCQIDLPPCGSRIVPQVRPVRQTFAALRTCLAQLPGSPSIEARIRGHNLYTVFTYLAYLWASGVRPFEGGIPDRRDLVQDAHGDVWVRVMDKDNPRRAEARVLRLPGMVAALLRALGEGGARTLRKLSALGAVTKDGVDENTLFFLIEDGRAVRLVYPERQVRHLLAVEGLAALYPFPLNCHRPFWFTWALEQGIPLDQLEPPLGHQHPGLELMTWYALQSQRRATDLFCRVATAILQLLDVRVVPYPW